MPRKSTFDNYDHGWRREPLLGIHEHFARRRCTKEPHSSGAGQLTLIEPGKRSAYVRRELSGRPWSVHQYAYGIYEEPGAHRFDTADQVIAYLEQQCGF